MKGDLQTFFGKYQAYQVGNTVGEKTRRLASIELCSVFMLLGILV